MIESKLTKIKQNNFTNCILCDSINQEIYIDAAHISCKKNILKCRNCGLVFFETDNHAFPLDNSYWDEKPQKSIYEKDDVYTRFEKEFKDRMLMIENLKEKGTLLDIGCGLGHFLSVARESGWKSIGVEISPSAVKYVRENSNLEVHEGTVENCDIENNSVDVITMWDVIEHIQNPIEALSAVRNKLKKGGMLVIKTPDNGGLFKAFSIFLYRLTLKKIFFQLKYVYYVPHYFYYNKVNIRKLLEKFNFGDIKIANEQTDCNFAKEKITSHYENYLSKNFILAFLPFFFLIARILRMQNKMIIHATKYE